MGNEIYANLNLEYLRRQSIYGGRRDFWVVNSNWLNKFIKENKLKPIPMEELVGGGKRKEVNETEYVMAKSPWPWPYPYPFPWPIPYPGGIKIAHLHYKNDIFYLNDAQWKDFSKHALRNMQNKLNKARAVSYDQLMDLSDAIDVLG